MYIYICIYVCMYKNRLKRLVVVQSHLSLRFVKRFTGLILTVLLSIPTKDDNTWLFYDHVPHVSSLIAR